MAKIEFETYAPAYFYVEGREEETFGSPEEAIESFLDVNWDPSEPIGLQVRRLKPIVVRMLQETGMKTYTTGEILAMMRDHAPELFENEEMIIDTNGKYLPGKTITVNGVRHQISSQWMDYYDAVALMLNSTDEIALVKYSVVWQNSQNNVGGILHPGGPSIPVADGLVFDVAYTGAA